MTDSSQMTPTKVALIVPVVTADAKGNLARVMQMLREAVDCGASFLLLPETVLTGLLNNDDPEHDLPLGQSVPGPATEVFGAFCSRHGVWLGFGLLEREDDHLFDSAALIGPDGAVHLVYRRNHRGWHGRNATPAVYREGTEVLKTETPLGSAGFLLCGDLFDDDVVGRFRDLHADVLLHLLACSFDDGAADQRKWDEEEFPDYVERIKLAQTPSLMVNYIGHPTLEDDNGFGGAWYVSAEGEVLASFPLAQEGILYVTL